MLNGNNEVTVNYILENDDRLDVACAVHEAWEQLRKVIICNFVTNLGDLLREDGWDVELRWPVEDARAKGNLLRARRASWSMRGFLQLAGETYGPNNLRISFCEFPSDDPAFGQCQLALQGVGWRGWSDPASSRPWQVNLGDLFNRQWDYQNWGTSEAIRDMGKRSNGKVSSALLEAFRRFGNALEEMSHSTSLPDHSASTAV
jgi:hypothetical protein